jgi:hypothetical protein
MPTRQQRRLALTPTLATVKAKATTPSGADYRDMVGQWLGSGFSVEC